VLAVRDPARVPVHWARLADLRVEQIPDLAGSADLTGLLRGVETVVHVAGLAHQKAGEAQFMAANAGATQALCQAAAGAGVRRFIHLSSIAAISPNAVDVVIDDETPPAPPSAYGRSKRIAETHVDGLAASGVMAISLRPPLIVGHDAPGNWESLLRLAATGAPLPFASIANARSFVAASSLAEAVALLCETPADADKSGNYALADSPALSTEQALRLIREGMGMPPRLFPFPEAAYSLAGMLPPLRRRIDALTGNLRIDSSRFRDAFGFTPTIALEDAVRESGRDFLRHRRGERGNSA
jgi:UDP-glucose 4-epimerase